MDVWLVSVDFTCLLTDNASQSLRDVSDMRRECARTAFHITSWRGEFVKSKDVLNTVEVIVRDVQKNTIW